MNRSSDMRSAAEGCEVRCVHPEVVGRLRGQVLDGVAADKLPLLLGLLADPSRARILHALSLADELCVCDLALVVDMSQSATSHQLRQLRAQRVVERRKAGRVVYYRLADHHVRHVLADGLRHALEPAPAGGVER
jgi:DNA-binding transcriptional ArsR family regulator